MGVRWRERVGCEDESLASIVVLSIPGRPPPPLPQAPFLFFYGTTPLSCEAIMMRMQTHQLGGGKRLRSLQIAD